MSSQGDVSSNQSNEPCPDRVVTDSVHGRFRPIQVHCDTCNLDIVGKPNAIEKHFDEAHPSTEYCCYCRGKVFTYTQIPINSTDNEKPQKFVYHKCQNT